MHCDLLMNEIEGYEAIDNSTLVHPLTNNRIQFVEGKLGQALEMHAEYRESIEMMNVPELNPSQFSISSWVKPTTVEPYGVLVSHSNRAQTSGWQFDSFGGSSSSSRCNNNNPSDFTNPSLRFGVFNTNGTLLSPCDILLSKDTFTHVTATFDGLKVRLYQDGELIGEREFLGNYTWDPGLPLRIGSPAYCSSCNRWSGIIDDVRTYNRTLGGVEVKQLFGASSDVSTGLIGYWKFDGDARDALGRHEGTSITILTSIVFAPDGRLFFTEKNTGEIRIMTPESRILDKTFASIDDLYVSWEQGILGLTIDPEFPSNRFVYVYYTALVDPKTVMMTAEAK